MVGGTEDRMGISTQHVPDCPLGIVFVFALNCIYNYYRELLPKSREYNAEGLAQGIARSVIRNIETSVSSLRPPADSCQARNKDFFRSNQTLVFGPVAQHYATQFAIACHSFQSGFLLPYNFTACNLPKTYFSLHLLSNPAY